MKVRCVSDYVTEEQRATLGRRYHQGWVHRELTIGNEYLVLGLTFEFDSDRVSTGPYVLVLHEVHGPRSYDLGLFTITDPRASRYWEVRRSQTGGVHTVNLWPPALYSIMQAGVRENMTLDEQDEAYFAALRSDEFKRMCALLQDEYADAPS